MNPDIYREIKRRILYLEYAPGQILNEQMLAKEFGVSRTPMREVLYRLAWEQLARTIARTGTMVTEIEFQKMLHAFQTRLSIEGEVGRLCTESATDDHLAEIRGIRRDCALLADNKNPKGVVDVDRRFRRVLHAAAGNPVLKSVSDQLYTLTFRLWYITLGKGDWQALIRDVLAEIDDTLAGMQTGDGMQTARVRRDALMRHFDRIRAGYLGVPGEMRW